MALLVSFQLSSLPHLTFLVFDMLCLSGENGVRSVKELCGFGNVCSQVDVAWDQGSYFFPLSMGTRVEIRYVGVSCNV